MRKGREEERKGKEEESWTDPVVSKNTIPAFAYRVSGNHERKDDRQHRS
jgi:hypothetical protein